jgi:N-acyl-D-amino-acid deacylase
LYAVQLYGKCRWCLPGSSGNVGLMTSPRTSRGRASRPVDGLYDLVIHGGTVYDGTGGAGIRADVAVAGERIVAVGAVGGAARASSDATGLAVCPGFIDVHSHDDYAVLLDPLVSFKVLQGVTTEIVGNCGSGVSPFEAGRAVFRTLHPDADPAPWGGLAGYLQRIDTVGPSLNVAALRGPARRDAACRGRPARQPTRAELDQMRRWLRNDLEMGAVGLSSGLMYEPGHHARSDELVALARELAAAGAVYATHLRSEGSRLLEAVEEAILIGEQAGKIPVQLSHHKASGRANWGRVEHSLRLVEQARRRGLDVTTDVYPYTASSTWLAALVDQDAAAIPTADGLQATPPADLLIAATPGHPSYEGRTLADLMAAWDLPAELAARRLLAEEGQRAWVVQFSMAEADVRTVLAHPTTMIGSDGLPSGGKPHPRLWGCFPRVLGRYVRRERVLDLATAIHRMTGLPATKFGLRDRGLVRAGGFADLVVLDPQTIADQATYTDPTRPPVGIHAVYVNGQGVVRDGVHTGARPGRALRRGH